MLNDRQTLIKAAPGSPPVTVQWGQRGDDKWRDKSSMPTLDQGQISRISQHGRTILAPSQTIRSPQWTSTIARLSHLSAKLGGPEPRHPGVLEPRGESCLVGGCWIWTMLLCLLSFCFSNLEIFFIYKQGMHFFCLLVHALVEVLLKEEDGSPLLNNEEGLWVIYFVYICPSASYLPLHLETES